MIKYLNLLLFAGMLIMNYLANALPLNRKSTGELSDQYPNLFVPAGITFSIWGIIYLLLAVYCVIQFTGSGQLTIISISWLFAATCLLNASWIVAWHYQKLPLSLLIMILILVALLMINTRITDLNKGLIKASFGVYLGWICIATIANVTALLVNYHWNGFGISEVAWAIIMIAIGAAIVSVSVISFKNPFIGLAVIWAFTGIIIKRNADYKQIVIAAAIGILIVAIVSVFGFLRKP